MKLPSYKEKKSQELKSQIYNCYLNGSFYGRGSVDYMFELFQNYVLYCDMYGKKECVFKIERI